MKNQSEKKKPYNSYVKYSALAFQMAATIIIFVFIGKFADQYFGNEKPVLIAIFSVLGVFLSLYNLIKEVKNNDN